MKSFLIAMALFILILPGVLSLSYREVTTKANITIGRDLVANMNQSIPIDVGEYGALVIEMNRSFDFFGSDYYLVNAWSNNRTSKHYQNGSDYHFPLNFPGDAEGHEYLFIQYRAMPVHRSETLVGYNFFLDYDEEYSYNQPYYSIHFDELFIPLYSNYNYSGENPLRVNLSEEDKEILTIYFIKEELPEGWVKDRKGDFRLFGPKAEVEKTKKILENLTFMPEMLERLTGEYDLETSNIIIADIEDDHLDIAGRAYGSNIIILDKSIFEDNRSDIQIASTLLHEYAHLIGDNFFKGGLADAQWVDEGLSVLSEIVAFKEYWGIESYWIEDRGEDALLFENGNLFTSEELRKVYRKNFKYDAPENEEDSYEFYNHAGLVFYNFYLDNGDEGMRRLYSMIRDLNPTEIDCEGCDTEHVINTMKKISGKDKSYLLFPYKDKETFEEDVKKLVRWNLSEDEKDKIFAEHFKSTVTEEENEREFEEQGLNDTEEEISDLEAIIILGAVIIIIAGVISLIVKIIKKRKNKE